MARFSGKQYRGAMRAHRDKRHHEAIHRQRRLINHGLYWAMTKGPELDWVRRTPAPIDGFLRKQDRTTTE